MSDKPEEEIVTTTENENKKQSEIPENVETTNTPETQENNQNKGEAVIQEEKNVETTIPEEKIEQEGIKEGTTIPEEKKEEKTEQEGIKEGTTIPEEKKEEKTEQEGIKEGTTVQEEKPEQKGIKEETTIKEEKSNSPNQESSNSSSHNSNKNLNKHNKDENKEEVEDKSGTNTNKNDEENEDEDKDEDERDDIIEEDELINNDSTPRNTNSPVTPGTGKLSAKDERLNKKKEILLLREKKKQQEKKEKNKIRYLNEEEIDLAFKWFTKGKQILSPNDIKLCFDQYFTNISKNDKKYYVVGGIKQDTRHLVNTREEKIQSEMFNSTQSISSIKKMLLKYPFKSKDYDNAFSILCGGDHIDILSREMINKYIDIFKENEVPVKNDIEKIYRCFDKDKDGELNISDLFRMKKFDLKKISDDIVTLKPFIL
ncbi:hypothetical protein PIROE2DRAFT_7237 [Piromyces sp. E2]|nr:hypothetical protein PIROE2DRAFT_7237 [Piromyces sp. E2]|eukprot:OUM65731.1 hypothetical protein PIROE2DRAFT_7237 [Piromyces sp. E2]